MVNNITGKIYQNKKNQQFTIVLSKKDILKSNLDLFNKKKVKINFVK